nr:hypothetical protein CFP56_44510 [Quercus suber]
MKPSNTWRAAAGEVRRHKVVEPEDADNAAGAIINSEFEEFVRFEFPGGDGADGLGTGKKGASARKGNGV